MKKPRNQNWTREEHILAFNLYCRIPFGKIGMRNPMVQELAAIIKRSPGAVSFKLTNFARLDPSLQSRGIRGHEHGALGEEKVWAEFGKDPEGLAYESERLLSSLTGRRLEEVAEIDEHDLPGPGCEREALVRLRVNQAFFRKRVLSAYDFQCCVTGISVRPLLVASHIIPWAKDPSNRLNPKNGLCLNALHDRAFDRGMMWIDGGGHVRFSPQLALSAKQDATLAWLTSFEGSSLRLRTKFQPDFTLLREHANGCTQA